MTALQYLFLVVLQAAMIFFAYELWQDMRRRQKRRRKEKPAP